MPTQGFNIKSVIQNDFKLNVWDIGGTDRLFEQLSACFDWNPQTCVTTRDQSGLRFDLCFIFVL